MDESWVAVARLHPKRERSMASWIEQREQMVRAGEIGGIEVILDPDLPESYVYVDWFDDAGRVRMHDEFCFDPASWLGLMKDARDGPSTAS
jgi:hypothetical protein